MQKLHALLMVPLPLRRLRNGNMLLQLLQLLLRGTL
jgi:hypothetical protein